MTRRKDRNPDLPPETDRVPDPPLPDLPAPDRPQPAMTAPDLGAPDLGAPDLGAPDPGAADPGATGSPPSADPVAPRHVAPAGADAAASRRPGLFTPLLGGALAAVAGFGLSHFNLLGSSQPDQSAEIAALGTRLDTALAALEAGQAALGPAVDRQVAALSSRLEALETAPAVDLAAMERRLQALETLPPGGDAGTAALAARLADLEAQLAAPPDSAAATAEVDAALARLAGLEAEARARAEEAAALAAAAAKARALEALAAAAASGAPFAAELSAVADPDLDAALAPHVGGVPPLASLQAEFPERARAVLQAARAADPGAGWGTRMVDFLAAQTGARSVTPRDGADPDAILSRAEFALGAGRLADALAELAALDPRLAAPLAEWLAAAEARALVDAAIAGDL